MSSRSAHITSCAMQTSANCAGTNRMSHGGHTCSLNVSNRGCWVSGTAVRPVSFAALDLSLCPTKFQFLLGAGIFKRRVQDTVSTLSTLYPLLQLPCSSCNLQGSSFTVQSSGLFPLLPPTQSMMMRSWLVPIVLRTSFLYNLLMGV